MKSPVLLHIFCFACIDLFILLIGYVFIRRRMVFASWVLMVFMIAIIHVVFINDSPILRMLSIIAITFSGMKVITTATSYNRKPLTLSFGQWLAFGIGWAGMRAEPFEKLGALPVPGGWGMIGKGIARIFAGLLLLLIGHEIGLLSNNGTLLYFFVSAILLAGLSLILHFGLLSISAGLWRFAGVHSYLLFRQPAHASRLTEFWGKRWNIAFSEMTSIAIFRPLKDWTGNATALMLAFLFSGLLHELALTVPVNRGYGLPLLYFIIQGCGVLVEKALTALKATPLQNPVIARSWVFLWVAASLPLLFNHQFMEQIVWPLAGLTI